jgi:formylglycine-generating enzyme required for sulfatase activity
MNTLNIGTITFSITLIMACGPSSNTEYSLATEQASNGDCGEYPLIEDTRIEGMEVGDCTDGADNDADGYFDCNDSSCFGAPACDSSMMDTGLEMEEDNDGDEEETGFTAPEDPTLDNDDTESQTTEEYSLYLGNGIDMELALVPAGTFTMGSPASEVGRYHDEEQHQVTLTNDFYVMTTEVTQGMFYAMMGYDSRERYLSVYGNGDDYPAYYVSWHMSAAFANATTAQHNSENGTSLSECYTCTGEGDGTRCTQSMDPYQCDGYRLLTEAEWEYAARAGSTAAVWTPNGGGNIPNGEELECNEFSLSDGTDMSEISWYCANANTSSSEVGQLIPNDYGLYDMIGNVWEWTHDAYAEYDTDEVTDPVTTDGRYRVFRGGYWGYTPYKHRSAERSGIGAKDRSYIIGFRIGISL